MSGECNICGGEHAELRCPASASVLRMIADSDYMGASGGTFAEHEQLHTIADQYAEMRRSLSKIAALCDEAGKPENRCATPDIFRQIAKIAKGE